MTDLLAARSQMALSLAFHIVFAVAGIGMPLLMAIAEAIWLRTRDPVDLELVKRWSRGTAILFAVGAVSGTVLSFELGLLWPEFMARAGAVIGMPFALEGFAFFVEAIFLGIYLYGWDRVPERLHWASGVVVAVAGAASAVFVVTVNAWMNTPAGADFVDGQFTRIRPFEAMMNPAAAAQVTHMVIAAYQALGFAVAGIHSWMLLRDPSSRFHRRALSIALAVGCVAAVLQPLSGDWCARVVARYQPVKLAAMEGQFHTERGAPLRIGGWPDEASERTRFALEIPGGLSFLAYGDASAEVAGLDSVPPGDRPPVAVVHVAFQIMVGAGTWMAAVALLAAGFALRRRAPADSPAFLRLLVATAPLGFIAIEAGWTVTEVGRQPWVIHGILRTSEAVTPVPGLIVPLVTFTFVYLGLALVVVTLLRRQVFSSRLGDVAR